MPHEYNITFIVLFFGQQSRRMSRGVFLALIALLLAARAAAADGARLAKPFSPCRLPDPLQLKSIEAECAEIHIAESDAVGARRISLSVARIPAINRRKQVDPIVLLAGGPGQGAQQTFTAVSSVFARAGRERDILLLDQRGTGRSNLLGCEAEGRMGTSPINFDTAAFIRLNERCQQRLARSNDLSAYTTSRAVRDLEAVRALLGYATLNLYGGSYGTRVAQHYARRYPQRVRSMVLDGAVAPQTVLGPSIALDAQAALDGVWALCSADEKCRNTFGDVASKTRQLQQALARAPQRVQIAHPRTALMAKVDLGPEQLAVVLRFGTYDPGFAALLPLVVSEAARGEYRPLATLFLLVTAGVQQAIAMGMHNAVICSEDVPRFAAAKVDRAALGASYLGTAFVDALPAICSTWPRGLVDADFHAPLVSAIPTLLLSGTLDPVTPPGDAARVATTLRNSRHLAIKGSAHGQIGISCMDRVLAEFFDKVDPQALDAKCLERRMQPPFWLSIAGPAP